MKFIRPILFTLFFLSISLISSIAYSQAKHAEETPTITSSAKYTYDSDSVKIGTSFTNFTDRLKVQDFFPTSSEDFQGISVSGDFKLFRFDRFKISGSTEFTNAFIDADKVRQFIAGPKLSFNSNDKLEFYGQVRYGYTEGQGLTKTFTKSYGFGADINIGNFYVRPMQVDYQYLEGFTSHLVKLSTGLGLRF